MLPISLDLLIFDISEVLYLDFIKDNASLRRSIRTFYDWLHLLANFGTTCIVFTNDFHDYQIFSEPIYLDITKFKYSKVNFKIGGVLQSLIPRS